MSVTPIPTGRLLKRSRYFPSLSLSADSMELRSVISSSRSCLAAKSCERSFSRAWAMDFSFQAEFTSPLTRTARDMVAIALARIIVIPAASIFSVVLKKGKASFSVPDAISQQIATSVIVFMKRAAMADLVPRSTLVSTAKVKMKNGPPLKRPTLIIMKAPTR